MPNFTAIAVSQFMCLIFPSLNRDCLFRNLLIMHIIIKREETCLSFETFVMLQQFPSMSVWSQNDAINSCHIYHEDKNGCFILDQIGSDLSKMD